MRKSDVNKMTDLEFFGPPLRGGKVEREIPKSKPTNLNKPKVFLAVSTVSRMISEFDRNFGASQLRSRLPTSIYTEVIRKDGQFVVELREDKHDSTVATLLLFFGDEPIVSLRRRLTLSLRSLGYEEAACFLEKLNSA